MLFVPFVSLGKLPIDLNSKMGGFYSSNNLYCGGVHIPVDTAREVDEMTWDLHWDPPRQVLVGCACEKEGTKTGLIDLRRWEPGANLFESASLNHLEPFESRSTE